MTQGLVTVMQGDRVALKVVAGCSGYNAARLARRLRALGTTDPEEARKLAADADFGCHGCVVVVSPDQIVCHPTMDKSEIPARYRETFDRPEFNPRWENGTADYVEVVRLEAAQP